MGTAQTAVIEAVTLLQMERDELRGLLASVAKGYVGTDSGDLAHLRIPADVMAEIQLRINA